MPALMASRMTSQMNILFRGTVLSLYPQLNGRKLSLLAWVAVVEDADTFEELSGGVAAPFGGSLSITATNASWKTRCGGSCPRLWRSLQNLEGVGVFQWGAGAVFAGENVVWRIGDACFNKKCEYVGRSN